MLLKSKDLNEKTVAELEEELKNLREELFKHRMNYYSRQLENTAELKNTKKTIARVLTIIKRKKEEEQAA